MDLARLERKLMLSQRERATKFQMRILDDRLRSKAMNRDVRKVNVRPVGVMEGAFVDFFSDKDVLDASVLGIDCNRKVLMALSRGKSKDIKLHTPKKKLMSDSNLDKKI